MEGKRFIRTLRLKNLLSYGSEGEEIELQPLNVLIGPNASGKSNLIEAISLLNATPKDLPAAIRKGGGISEWLWKGGKDIPIAEIEASIDYPQESSFLSYQLDFNAVDQRLEIVKERIEYKSGNYKLFIRDKNHFLIKINQEIILNLMDLTERISEESILSKTKDQLQYTELTYLENQFSKISLYRDWHIGRDSKSRKPQQTDLQEHPLLEDASNLELFLHKLQYHLGSRPIIEKLKKVYDAAEEITPRISDNTVKIFIREEGHNQPIPASRLSDGTLRYLFLLALLLDPTPPPLICIEEPEIGFHPDILPTIAEMLIEASQRTQLIVTTHSDTLVSALPPESVVVCERDERGSHLRRLEPERLKNWLENYSLGDLWRMGEIGGNRW